MFAHHSAFKISLYMQPKVASFFQRFSDENHVLGHKFFFVTIVIRMKNFKKLKIPEHIQTVLGI